MMAKPVNLSEMLWNRTDNAGAPSLRGAPQRNAQSSIAAADLSAAGRQGGNAAGRKSGESGNGADIGKSAPPRTGNAPVSFQQRVKESSARLGKEGHHFFKQPQKGQPVQAHGNASRAGAQQRSSALVKETFGPQTASEASAQARGRAPDAAPARAGRPQGEGEKISRQDMDQVGDDGNAPSQAAGTASDARDASSMPQDAQADASDGKDLENGLKQMGIEVTQDQLNDPAFLGQLLQLVQSFISGDEGQGSGQADAGVQAVDAQPDSEAGASAPDAQAIDAEAPVFSLADSAPASAAADPKVSSMLPQAGAQGAPSGKPDEASAKAENVSQASGVTRPTLGELEGLIKDRLAALNANPPAADGATAGISPSVSALKNGVKMDWHPQATLPGNLQAIDGNSTAMAREGRRDEIATGDQAPAVDQDRLRVLQTAGINMDKAARDARPADLGMKTQPEKIDGISHGEDKEPQSWVSPAGAADAKTADEDGAQTNLFGQETQGNAAQAGKEAAPAPRHDGTFFQNALGEAHRAEARSLEAKPAPQPFAAPDQPAVLSQIARKLSALNHREGGVVSIQLEPEHLGKVRVSLEMKDGAMSARIGVENEDVRRIVDQNIGNLRGTLEDQGIKLQGLEVSVEQRHSSLFNPDGSNAQEFFHRRGGESRGAAAGAEISDADSAESDTGRRLGYNTMEYIA
jgi:flagellar hook-length control protein FliK